MVAPVAAWYEREPAVTSSPATPPRSDGATACPGSPPSAATGRSRHGALLAVVSAFVLAAALYSPSSRNPLIWDDELHVPIAAKMGVGDAFGKVAGEYRRPLVLLSYAAQIRLGVGSAHQLHAGNAILHGANAALVAAVVLAAGGTAATAFASAVLFAFHPLASGSVAYISGRTDLLAAFFLLLAAWLAMSRRLTGTMLVSVWLAVAAAALGKESGLLAGPLVAAVLWWRRSREDVPAWQVVSPVVASLLVAPVVWPAAAAAHVPIDVRLRAAGTALRTYASLLAWPAGLHLDRLTPTGDGGDAILGGLLLATMAAMLVAFVRRPRPATLLTAALVLLYLPASGFVPAYPAIADHLVFTGEQLLYAPLAALGIATGASLSALTGFRGLVPLAAAVLAMLGWTLPDLVRQREFASAEQVYRKTLTFSPSPRACFNLGNLQLLRRELEKSVTTLTSCARIAPNDARIHGQLGVALQKSGYAEDARQEYDRSLELDATDALVWSNYASLDANAGRYSEAREKWQRALALDPEDETAKSALKRLDAAGR